jgi:hypothetical protein
MVLQGVYYLEKQGKTWKSRESDFGLEKQGIYLIGLENIKGFIIIVNKYFIVKETHTLKYITVYKEIN